MVQGKWNLLENSLLGGRLSLEERRLFTYQAMKNPLAGFLGMLEAAGGFEEERVYILESTVDAPELVGSINETLRPTVTDEGIYTTGTLIDEINGVIARFLIVRGAQGAEVALDTAEVDDSDHGAMDADAEEEVIDWGEITEQGFKRLDQAVLYNIFVQLVEHHCEKASAPMPGNLEARFQLWLDGGPVTRARFKKLIGISPEEGDETPTILQAKRTGNTFSFNGPYDGKSNGFQYKNVIYYRDAKGNIDFTQDPTTIVAQFNQAEGKKIKPSSIQWSDPQDGSSEVELGNDLKDKNKGVMPSGKKVALSSASRSQHFAIADSLYSNDRKGKWTWHHLTPKYKMVLVDMRVHAKHGHNGGFLLW